MKEYWTVVGDILYRREEGERDPETGTFTFEHTEPIITKEAFIECMTKWGFWKMSEG